MSKNHGNSRRKILKTSAAALTGLAGMSTVSGASSGEGEGEEPGRGQPTVSGSGSAATSSGTTTKRGYEKRRARAGTAPGEIGTQQTGTDPTRENLEYLDHDEARLELEGSYYSYADIDYTLTVFEAVDNDGNPLTDSNGYYYYVAEYLAVADVYKTLYEMDLYSDANSTDIMESRDPATSSSVNGDWVTLQEGATINGTGYTTESATWVDHGTFGPETWTPGGGGDFGVMYDGSWSTGDGEQFDIIGFASIKSPSRAYSMWGVIDEWHWHGRAGW